jgi:hypothetical protein
MPPWFSQPQPHSITLLNGALLDQNPETGQFSLWEAVRSREGHAVSFPCLSAASGTMGVSHQLVAMDEFFVDYDPLLGFWRALYCPPNSVREGLPNPSCRKLGAGRWSASYELAYLGLGRMMLWQRSTLHYEVWSAVSPAATTLRNVSEAPFFTYVASGRLTGLDNRSSLHHLRLPVVARTSGGAQNKDKMHVHVVLELLPAGSYRVWNSEGWATRAAPRMERIPLAGPVGRGHFPPSDGSVVWVTSATDAALVELDTREGTYRAIGVSVLDMDSLNPGTSTQPPLQLAVQLEGVLDVPTNCESATSRSACAALGGACGWCEQTDGIRTSRCTSGGPWRPCLGECGAWLFDGLTSTTPAPVVSPPPSPPGLSEADLLRLEAHSRATELEVERQPPPISLQEVPDDALPHRVAAERAELVGVEQPQPSRWSPWVESASSSDGARGVHRLFNALRQHRLLP